MTWTPERRLRQSQIIQKYKPWLKSTGAKTAAGKEKSKMNAYKHGDYSVQSKIEARKVRGLIRICRVIFKGRR